MLIKFNCGNLQPHVTSAILYCKKQSYFIEMIADFIAKGISECVAKGFVMVSRKVIIPR